MVMNMKMTGERKGGKWGGNGNDERRFLDYRMNLKLPACVWLVEWTVGVE
jgi:hypothetical protein